jgi:7-carboxy-7-deazaguanine synthase
MSGSVVVNEIFTSIQGESTLAGRPCTFVRLTGCNLRCSYCDTTYAFHEGHSKEIGTIAEEVERRGVPFVTVTGGEPLLQEDVHALIRTLLDRGYEIQVESSGAVETGGLDPRARVILDIKR